MHNMVRKMLTSALAFAALGLLGFASLTRAGDDCCPTKKTCESVTETKKVSKRVYDNECYDKCYPKCGLSVFVTGLFKGWRTNDCCDTCNSCASCEGKCACKPRNEKYLLIKIRTHEECVHKCVPVEQCCTTGCEAAPAAPAGPKPEIIPAPKGDGKGGDVDAETLPALPFSN
jgi:hypothetical protein